MSLAIGLNSDGSTISFRRLNTKGKVSEHPLRNLLTQGFANNFQAKSLRVVGNFSDWQSVNFEEYAGALDYPITHSMEHQAWVFLSRNQRIVIPALVLVRALFLSYDLLLPQLFRPQSLDDFCFFDPEVQRLVFTKFVDENMVTDRRLNSVEPFLSWASCFPTGRRLWASIYGASTHGVFGLELPDAEFSTDLWGHSCGKNFYVTRMVFQSFKALEPPFEYAEGRSTEVTCNPHKVPVCLATRSIKIVPAPCGRIELSNDEWEAVKAILAESKIRKLSDTTRKEVDATLWKLINNVTYEEAAEAFDVPWTTIAQQAPVWVRRGIWESIQSHLNKTRGGEEPTEDD